MIKGIDISRWQGEVNFDELVKDVQFVIIKASEGCPDPGQSVAAYEDKEFKRNQSEARRIGIGRGYYHFARPDVNDPDPEAEEFVNAVGELQDGEILALDFEVSTSKDVVAWCYRFLKRVEEILDGYRPLLYINLATANAHDWSPVIHNNNGLWLAQWDFNPDAPMNPHTQWPVVAIRQYSDKEEVAGIHPVDGDVFYGSPDAFQQYGFHKTVYVPSQQDIQKANEQAMNPDETNLTPAEQPLPAEQNDATPTVDTTAAEPAAPEAPAPDAAPTEDPQALPADQNDSTPSAEPQPLDENSNPIPAPSAEEGAETPADETPTEDATEPSETVSTPEEVPSILEGSTAAPEVVAPDTRDEQIAILTAQVETLTNELTQCQHDLADANAAVNDGKIGNATVIQLLEEIAKRILGAGIGHTL